MIMKTLSFRIEEEEDSLCSELPGDERLEIAIDHVLRAERHHGNEVDGDQDEQRHTNRGQVDQTSTD